MKKLEKTMLNIKFLDLNHMNIQYFHIFIGNREYINHELHVENI